MSFIDLIGFYLSSLVVSGSLTPVGTVYLCFMYTAAHGFPNHWASKARWFGIKLTRAVLGFSVERVVPFADQFWFLSLF